jgi:hypothetical protein
MEIKMTRKEIVAAFERRNPYDCYVMAVELSIRDIVDEIFDIIEGKPKVEDEDEDEDEDE